MSERTAPPMAKWPFIVSDLLLLTLAGWIVCHYPRPLATVPLLLVVACVAFGAWVCVTPFLMQHRADLQFAEAAALTNAVEQINTVRNLANQISFATAQWQIVQEHSGRTVNEARDVAERMTAEAKAFAEFLDKANDAEKAHLRLEVDKLRRGEAEWVQIIVRLLDHVFALYQAGVRSAQPVLIEQLGNFQTACRDAARRVGLVPFEAQADAPFDEKLHQLPDSDAKAPADARVVGTIATGYTYQGQLLRRALVSVEAPPAAPVIEAEPQLTLGDPS
jgi:molecular chaperone GrpE (heat shock protein)